MTTTLNMHEAKSSLSKLVENVQAGDEVIIARDGHPVAKLVPFMPLKRSFGFLRGQVAVPDDSEFKALTDEETSELFGL